MCSHTPLLAETIGSLWPSTSAAGPAAIIRVSVLALAVLVNVVGERAVAWSTEWLVAAVLLGEFAREHPYNRNVTV